MFYPHFSVLSPFQRCIPISVFYPHFSVLSPFQCFIPISVFYPHFSVLSPFQFPFQPFSFSVLSRPVLVIGTSGYKFSFLANFSRILEKFLEINDAHAQSSSAHAQCAAHYFIALLLKVLTFLFHLILFSSLEPDINNLTHHFAQSHIS